MITIFIAISILCRKTFCNQFYIDASFGVNW